MSKIQPTPANHYFQAIYQRKNIIKEFIYTIFLMLSSGPRMLLEVFTRSNMGQRYFSLMTCILLVFFLSTVPFEISSFSSIYRDGHGFWRTIFIHITWYLYLAGFSIFSMIRWLEVKNQPTIEFKRFSKYTGDVNPYLEDIFPNRKHLRILWEPLIFLVAGIVLTLFAQILGPLLIFSSIVSSVSYMATYHLGTEVLLDKIDEMICNEEMAAVLVLGLSPEHHRGFEIQADVPTERGNRQKLNDMLTGNPVFRAF